ncbi:hypothetical protein ABPG77_010810 [Micractinium sp. CCAP 211/92]
MKVTHKTRGSSTVVARGSCNKLAAAVLSLFLLAAAQAQAPGLAPAAVGPAGSPQAPGHAPAPAPASAAAGPAASPSPSPAGGYNISQDSGSPPAAPSTPGLPWELLFIDDFQGDALDQSKWNYVLGDGSTYGLHGFSNGEVQWYTSDPSNVRVEGDCLVLQAQQADASNPWSATSGRVSTLDKFSIAPSAQFGTVRIEARMKVPRGSALWPAFWLLPQVGAWMQSTCLGCGAYGNWAASGEIDVAEAANDMTSVQGTIHYGGLYPANVQSHGSVYLPPNTSLADDFHVYAIEWEASQIRWYLDGYNYYTAYSAAISPPGSGWYTTAQGAGPNAPFDLPFYLILNLAVGGPQTVFTGCAPLGTTLNQPQQLFVDWVRVHGLPWALSQHQ